MIWKGENVSRLDTELAADGISPSCEEGFSQTSKSPILPILFYSILPIFYESAGLFCHKCIGGVSCLSLCLHGMRVAMHKKNLT